MMPLESAERSALLDSVRRFVADRYPAASHLARLQSDEHYDSERWVEIAELGWLAGAVDESNGGHALGYGLQSELVEALATGMPLEPFCSQTSLIGYLLNGAIPSDSRNDLLQRWLGGSSIVAFAHHEVRTGPYFNSEVKATYDPRGASFILNGRKFAVIDGGIADQLIVSCRSLDDPSLLKLFLVPSDCVGVRIERYRTFDGRDIADVVLSDVEVATDCCLEFAVDAAVLIESAQLLFTLFIASDTLGLTQTALRQTHAYLNDREQFGTKIANFQALQHRLVNMLLAVTRAESSLVIARQTVDDVGLVGASDGISAAKVSSAKAAMFVAQEAIQLHGAIGMTDEYIVGHYFKRITANGLLAGTSDEHLSRFACLRGFDSNPT
ncbi:MAG: alkylation response protein AidB-like acyl-CoA dehydrogenase [Gammaproteobacteria bacterium]|jgi:alkylation response protein AidB-like acyl-CoA dehydrogenase